MRSRAFRSVVGSLALVSLAIAVGACASGHSTPVDPSVIPKLAGKWTGYVVGKSGTVSARLDEHPARRELSDRHRPA